MDFMGHGPLRHTGLSCSCYWAAFQGHGVKWCPCHTPLQRLQWPTPSHGAHGLAVLCYWRDPCLIPWWLKRVFWPCLRRGMKTWAGSCVACQCAKVHCHSKAPLVLFLVPESHSSVLYNVCGGCRSFHLLLGGPFWNTEVFCKHVAANNAEAY